MRELLAAAMAGLLAGMCLAGCGSTPPATYTRYQFTCCDGSDVHGVWHPGQQVTLHWSSRGAQSTDGSTRMLTLSVSLSGPYSDVDSLKRGGAAATSLEATPVTASSGAPSSPVSTLALPADLAPGLYDLVGTAAAAGGSESSGTVVQVGLPHA